MQGKLKLDEHSFEIETQSNGDEIQISVDGTSFKAFLQENEHGFSIRIGEELLKLSVLPEQHEPLAKFQKTSLLIQDNETTISFQPTRKSSHDSTSASDLEPAEGSMIAFMPGTILRILVQEGHTAEAGEVLLILEAMKMENEIKAPSECTIDHIHVTTGTSVNKGDLLLQISPLSQDTPTDPQ